MEIQFTLPITSNRAHDIAGPPSRSTESTATGGGTHRFALESRTRHTRRSSTRARTGCSTCKKRHVKCDEAKPSCSNCIKWRGHCDGYTDSSDQASTKNPSSSSSSSTTSTVHRSKPTHTPNLTSKAKQKLKPGALITQTSEIPQEPVLATLCFANSEQRAYFDEWSALTINFLSGGLGQSRLWTTTMPQVTYQEPTLRYGAMAIGALWKARCSDAQSTQGLGENKHHLNAIVYYCEALRLQSNARPTKEGLRTAILSSLLFICFESQRGNIPAALKHITHGFSMLNELSACSDKAPGLVSIAQAPPALVQEILDCYKPMELQFRSFMGSYKKLFFPPKPPALTSKITPSSSPHAPENTSSPPSQPGSPWANTPPSRDVPTGLPSPQSQASPKSQPDQQTPPRPPQRPPGIVPFTKHSPYFRPRQTNITTIDNMPSIFKTCEEAQGYWSLLQRQMVQYIPLLAATTASLALPRVTEVEDLRAKLGSVRENPKIIKFVSESRYWLQRWSDSFTPLLHSASINRHTNFQLYLEAINLRLEYLVLYIYTAMTRFSDLENARSITPYYRELTSIAETLISCRPNCGFAMDSGWTWPLFIASFGCRDAAVRDDAIRVLEQYPVRNTLRDSRIYRAIALKNREIEMMNIQEGSEDDQWLRLRRRELVFEDLGSSIIFRSAQKNSITGEWELVEEVAAFSVGEDGMLQWRRQPISDSASILSGVC